MLESQGTRPLDPYRTLQLHPSAPRQLIVEAYWHLVSRRKLRGEPENAGDLNAAYGLLMDDDRRAAYDDEHVPAVGRAVAAPPVAADYYERLHIDREADAGIVALAYAAVGRERAADGAPDARESLDEASRILRNPQLRAQYDATLGTAAAVPLSTPTVVTPRVRPQDEDVPAIFRAGGGSDADGVSPKAVGSGAAPVQARGLFGRLRIGQKRTPPRPVRGVPRRFSSDQALDAAKDARLLTLEGEPLVPAPAETGDAPPPPGDAAALAALAFIAGPFAGLRIGLGVEVLTIGSGAESDVVLSDPGGRIAVEHARIWRHGEHFVFRQVEGSRSIIGGRRLDTALVILDDGDEIQIGQHRMTFTQSGPLPA